MLEKKVSYAHRITESGHIEVQQITRIMEDGIELAKKYHRCALNPGDDLSGQDERTVAVAVAIWTPEVVKVYKDNIEKQENKNG